MIIYCSECGAKVNAEEVGTYSGLPWLNPEEIEKHGWTCHIPQDAFSATVTLFKCSLCQGPFLVMFADYFEEGKMILYPAERQASYALPNHLRKSFDEAISCYKMKAFLATALMCRRTLEAMCRFYDPNINTLSQGLRSLHEKGIIDNRLLEWADALRRDGNLVAHDPNAEISEDDAKYLLDFTEAVLDNVFILRERFLKYQTQKELL